MLAMYFFCRSHVAQNSRRTKGDHVTFDLSENNQSQRPFYLDLTHDVSASSCDMSRDISHDFASPLTEEECFDEDVSDNEKISKTLRVSKKPISIKTSA